MRDLRLPCAVALLAAYAAALPHRDAASLQQDAWDQSMAARQQPNAPEKRKRRYAGEVRRNTQLWQQLPKGGMGGHGAGATLSRHASGTMMLDGEPLPRDFSWGNVSGVSYLTSIRNQHIPTYARSFYSAPARTHKSIHSLTSPSTLPLSLSLNSYCGSCWAFAATSVLADRWNVAYRNSGSPPPDLVLSTQNVLSCGNDVTGCGTCHGGDDATVFVYAQQHGIPHESCSNYMARDTTCRANAPIADDNRPQCYNCDEEAMCYSIREYHRLYVREGSIGTLSGGSAMKAEIRSNGPISCGIMATPKMEHRYNGAGVYSEPPSETDSRINHVVEVVGWGVDAKNNEYWSVRNSWGAEWGEGGFMRIVTSDNTGPAGTGNNLLETECSYATPDRYAMK